MLSALVTLFSALIIGYLFRGIIRFIPLSKGKLDAKCAFSLKWNDFAVYNGAVSRAQALLSLALPLIIFLIAFSAAAILTSEIIRVFSLFMVAISVCVCGPDIIMFIICLKRLKKNDVIFGEYVKQ